MTLWLKTRRPRLIVGSLIFFWVGTWTTGALEVPVPRLLQGVLGSVPLSVFLPLIPVGAVVTGLANSPAELDAAAARRTQWYDAGVVLFVVAVSVMVVVAYPAVAATLGTPTALMAARNLTGYLGLALLTLEAVGPMPAAFVPVVFAVVCVTFGTPSSGNPYFWAWPLVLGDHLPSTALASVIFVLGIGSLILRGSR